MEPRNSVSGQNPLNRIETSDLGDMAPCEGHSGKRLKHRAGHHLQVPMYGLRQIEMGMLIQDRELTQIRKPVKLKRCGDD